MTNYNKILNLLGIARRAGKIISGEGIVLNAVKKGKVKFLLIASDAGAATTKKFINKTNYYQIPVNNKLTKSDISDAIGQSRTIVGITDNGFARKLNELNE
ncbi:ribosomal L7Ae/L30e/S12e/Gadd45 family protein [Fructilactobacillus vespulae]|uniref:L7Ae/L30e/S12e/Gadd45 family ribosomal protein n=1 Tax=Fructilactobacillus vespulae TaxID=1249630 RepID=UPI0039B6914B